MPLQTVGAVGPLQPSLRLANSFTETPTDTVFKRTRAGKVVSQPLGGSGNPPGASPNEGSPDEDEELLRDLDLAGLTIPCIFLPPHNVQPPPKSNYILKKRPTSATCSLSPEAFKVKTGVLPQATALESALAQIRAVRAGLPVKGVPQYRSGRALFDARDEGLIILCCAFCLYNGTEEPFKPTLAKQRDHLKRLVQDKRHVCGCGAAFVSTDELNGHARRTHCEKAKSPPPALPGPASELYDPDKGRLNAAQRASLLQAVAADEERAQALIRAEGTAAGPGDDADEKATEDKMDVDPTTDDNDHRAPVASTSASARVAHTNPWTSSAATASFRLNDNGYARDGNADLGQEYDWAKLFPLGEPIGDGAPFPRALKRSAPSLALEAPQQQQQQKNNQNKKKRSKQVFQNSTLVHDSESEVEPDFEDAPSFSSSSLKHKNNPIVRPMFTSRHFDLSEFVKRPVLDAKFFTKKGDVKKAYRGLI